MDKLEYSVMLLASIIGITQIQSLLGVVILSFQVFLIIIKVVKWFIQWKKGKITTEQFIDKIEDTIEGINEVNNEKSNK